MTEFLTTEQLGEAIIESIEQMSPRERAQFRREVRKQFGWPEIADPDLWIN